MSLIKRMLGVSDSAPVQAGPLQDATWWGGLATPSISGVQVSTETALKISTVYACVRLISETIASLPLVTYRRMDDGGRRMARNHPLFDVLHTQPNQTQTAFEFMQMMMAHALLRGSGYARIVPGARGFVDQLEPLHPDRVEKEKLQNGRIRYVIRDESGRIDRVNQEDVFEIGGLSLDGVQTLSVVSYARDSFGMALAAEHYGARFYRNNSRPGGILTTEGSIKPEAAKRLKAQFEALHSGENQHRVAVLEYGLKWQAMSVTPEEAQFLNTREFQAEDVCRWFGVPPHMVGLTSKATSWGTGIESMSQGFVTYTLRPWLTRWTQAITRDLLLAPDIYFADFIVEDLLRGNIKDRYDAYAIARQWGWLSVNDIRRKENENPIANGDTYLQPMNMEPAARRDAAAAETPAPKKDLFAREHYRLLAEEAAGRLVRKEMAAMSRAWEKHGGNGEYETAVSDFYMSHSGLVATTMRIPLETAVRYCDEQRECMAFGVPDEEWATLRTIHLANEAIGVMSNG